MDKYSKSASNAIPRNHIYPLSIIHCQLNRPLDINQKKHDFFIKTITKMSLCAQTLLFLQSRKRTLLLTFPVGVDFQLRHGEQR